MKIFRFTALIMALTGSILLFQGHTPPEEGMYPLSEIANVDLVKAGLQIDPKEIYNPGGISLVDALVRVGGCTGSFVSDKGLILTNHHCVFDYVRAASTVENNYLENGLHAKTFADEIPAQGLTSMITEDYRDVSAEVLSAARGVEDPAERTKAIQKKIREIVDREEKKNSEIKAEVSEMFIGQTYILFIYRIIKDVRLVYIPPRSIGEFGGDSDNWMWPKHTGDFSFLRAYVGKDGKAAPYSKDNVPYTPKRFLKVNPNGVNEEDFVFILGYPGRTFRHQPADFVKFHETVQLPYIENLYSHLIDGFASLSKDDTETELKLAARRNSLANVQKNYLGKMTGMRRLALVEKKKKEEAQLLAYVNGDAALKAEYGPVFTDIAAVYNRMFELGRTQLAAAQLRTNVSMMRLASLLIDWSKEEQKEDASRKTMFAEKNRKQLMETIANIYKSYVPVADQLAFIKIAGDASGFKEMAGLNFIKALTDADGSKTKVKNFASGILVNSVISSKEKFIELFEEDFEDRAEAIAADPLLSYAARMAGELEPVEKEYDALNGRLLPLMAKLLDVKKMWQKKNFIPDANSTLRLTYGYIRGYSPRDATYLSPITTLRGLIEKSYGGGDYTIPYRLKELYDAKDYGRFVHPKLGDVPVAILYNMDTTGGNSGSPVMNAKGELIGVNFDRAFEATINDYAWSESYSRSIAVDIRYVLWVTQKFGGADHLLAEMGVN
ncbi:MAG: S46 family peptidase [Ignavibacteriaceae bacterium]|nr:S46 family peptidase [Ignavibacteriaceae bacterium]